MDINVIKSLKEIRTPLAFLSLALVAAEGLLYSLVDKVEGFNLTFITIGSPYKTVQVNNFNKLHTLASDNHNEKSGVCKVIHDDIP